MKTTKKNSVGAPAPTLTKTITALVVWAWLLFGFSDPFNWGTEDGHVSHVNPLGWMLFGVITYFLARFVIVNYLEWVDSLPKRTTRRNNRSHYYKLKGK